MNWTIKGIVMSAVIASATAMSGAAIAQTKGGTLTGIVQPEPPTLMLGLNQQAPTIFVAGKIYQSR